MPVVRYDECSVKGTIEYDKPQTGWRIEVDIIGAVFQGNYRKQKFPPFARSPGEMTGVKYPSLSIPQPKKRVRQLYRLDSDRVFLDRGL